MGVAKAIASATKPADIQVNFGQKLQQAFAVGQLSTSADTKPPQFPITQKMPLVVSEFTFKGEIFPFRTCDCIEVDV
jgi:hypothetical protein